MLLVLLINIKVDILKYGSCKHSDISVFSFHPVKTITTGEVDLFAPITPNFTRE